MRMWHPGITGGEKDKIQRRKRVRSLLSMFSEFSKLIFIEIVSLIILNTDDISEKIFMHTL
jgi:hypothetical protein